MKRICQCCSVNTASCGDKVGIHILSIRLAAKESILLSFCLWGRNSKVLTYDERDLNCLNCGLWAARTA